MTDGFSSRRRRGLTVGLVAATGAHDVAIVTRAKRDVDGYRPSRGDIDTGGELVPDRIYNQRSLDRTLVIDDLVARRVTEFRRETNERFQKTILFCVDQEHAARMRQALVNENADLPTASHRCVMRITGDDDDKE